MDWDGDGIGDIGGDYFGSLTIGNLGIDVVWICPLTAHSMMITAMISAIIRGIFKSSER